MAVPCDYLCFDLYTRTRFRYRYDEDVNHFIEAVVESAASRTVEWPQGTSLWRAQRGCRICIELPGKKHIWKDDTDICGHPLNCRPFSVERMKPEPEKAKEGRVNPKGIPCLYLATHEDTAMSEVRPWHEARISLARFELTQAVVLVDCSQECPNDLTNKEAWNWYSIGEAFSLPVSSSDDVSDYAPTQILAEAFRQRWYDGIIYNSGLNQDGKNVALFNLSHAEVKERFLYTLSDVSYFFYKHDTGEHTEEASALEGGQSQ
jgi:RES domain-containing protein